LAAITPERKPAAAGVTSALDVVLLCVEPPGRQFAVLMLLRDDEHRDTGLQEADIARAIGQHCPLKLLCQ
jgi:hypothetical protein